GGGADACTATSDAGVDGAGGAGGNGRDAGSGGDTGVGSDAPDDGDGEEPANGEAEAMRTGDCERCGVFALRRAGLCMRTVALTRTGQRGTIRPSPSGARWTTHAQARDAAAAGTPRSTRPTRRRDGASHPSTIRATHDAMRPTSGTASGTP